MQTLAICMTNLVSLKSFWEKYENLSTYTIQQLIGHHCTNIDDSNYTTSIVNWRERQMDRQRNVNEPASRFSILQSESTLPFHGTRFSSLAWIAPEKIVTQVFNVWKPDRNKQWTNKELNISQQTVSLSHTK